VLSLGATVLLAACSFSFGGGNNLDMGKLETEVENGISDQLQVTVTVDCPSDIKIEQGNNFQCTATDDQGNTRTVNVTQDDDKGNVSWQLGD
jgi:hypothetical protein